MLLQTFYMLLCYLLLPSLAVSMTISVLTAAVPSTLRQKVIESDSDAEATSGFESFGSFAGLQSLSKLGNFGDFADLDGQFDSSGFDRVFSAQNRRFDSGAVDEFPVPAPKAVPDGKAFHGVAASPVLRKQRPQNAAVEPQHSRYRATAAAAAAVASPAQRGPLYAPQASQIFRPAQYAVAAGALRPVQEAHPGSRPAPYSVKVIPNGYPAAAAQGGPLYAPQVSQIFRPAQYAVSAGALKPVQEAHPGSRPAPYSVKVIPNGYPAAAVTASYSVHPQPTKQNPQRYSAIHANKYQGRNAVYQPQGSSHVQSNKFREEFQRQLGGGFGDNEDHGFDFGPQGF